MQSGWRGLLRGGRWRAALVIGCLGLTVYAAVRQVHHDLGVSVADAEAYWQAALRLRDGLPLYFQSSNTGDAGLYWYAPWFAAAWVPLTLLPHDPVMTAWVVLQGLALGYLVLPLLRTPAGAALALLVGSLLVRTVLIGQVHVLMLAALAWGLRRRCGPIVIAAACSLKIFPILFAIRYLRRHQWRTFALTVGLSALLWAPILLFDFAQYPRGGFNPPIPLPLMLAGAAVAVAVALRSEKYGDLAETAAIILGNPRWNHYTPGYALADGRGELRATRPSSGHPVAPVSAGRRRSRYA
jgi:Glycosyltransferase family 87